MRERWVLGSYVTAVLLFGAVAMVAYLHLDAYRQQTEWVRHTEEVLTHLEEVLGDLRDAETGQRGFLLTGDETFLESYDAGLARLSKSLSSVATLTADNALQQRRIAAMRPLVDAKVTFLRRTLDAHRRGERELSLELVRSREGKRIMDSIRLLVGEMVDEEHDLLAQRMAKAETTSWRTGALFVFANAFAFALLGTASLLVGRERTRHRLLSQRLALARERESLLAETEAARSRLEAVLDELPVPVLLLDAGSDVVAFENEAATQLLERASAAADGRPAREALALSRADGNAYQLGDFPVDRARRGEMVHNEDVILTRRHGDTRALVMSAIPLGNAGIVVTLLDLTVMRRGEEERLAVERFRELFLGALGHDLRNPLSVITTGTQALARRTEDPAQGKLVERMGSCAERMARMIDQILDLAQARLGPEAALDRRPSDVAEIARRAIEEIEVRHPERSIELAVEGNSIAFVDPVRLRQVVRDLIVNAVEHGSPEAPIRIKVRGDDATAIVEVENAGPAIAPELLSFAFDPFRRASERRRLKSTGLGLGLYLAQHAAALHGGHIEVKSPRPGAPDGTLARVLLPRHGFGTVRSA